MEESPKEAALRYRWAVAAFACNDYGTAREQFDEAIRLGLEDSACYTGRAEVHLELANSDQAIKDASQAIELDSAFVNAYVLRAKAHGQLGQYEESDADWSDALRLAPEDSSVQYEYGIYQAGHNNLEQAITSLTEVIRLDSDDAFAFAERGFAYVKREETAKAEADWEEAMRLDPLCPNHYVQRGDSLRDAEKPERAIEAYTKALTLAPDNAGVLRSRATLYRKMKEYDKALTDLQTAIDLVPQSDGINFKRAGAYIQRGDILLNDLQKQDEAVAEFSKAIELEPQNGGPYRRRAETYFAMGDFEHAKADLARAAELKPNNDVPFRNGLIALFCQLGDYDKAVIELTELLEQRPNDGYALQLRAFAYYKIGDSGAAQADCDALLSLYQESPLQAHSRLASLYFALNRDDDAIAECFKATDATPADASTSVLKAALLMLADRPDLYREACADTLERFAQDEKPEMRALVARCCVLAPGAVGNPTQPVELADIGVAGKPQTAWSLHNLGMAHFRAGHLDEAEQRLRESLRVNPQWPATRLNYLGLALVYCARGDFEQATGWYAKAVEQIDQQTVRNMSNNLDCLEAYLLRREAERLFELSNETKPAEPPSEPAPEEPQKKAP